MKLSNDYAKRTAAAVLAYTKGEQRFLAVKAKLADDLTALLSGDRAFCAEWVNFGSSAKKFAEFLGVDLEKPENALSVTGDDGVNRRTPYATRLRYVLDTGRAIALALYPELTPEPKAGKEPKGKGGSVTFTAGEKEPKGKTLADYIAAIVEIENALTTLTDNDRAAIKKAAERLASKI